jgi:hypothetical protein
MCLKIKSNGNGNGKGKGNGNGFPAEAGPTVEVWPSLNVCTALLLVGLALAGKRPTQAPSIYRSFPRSAW